MIGKQHGTPWALMPVCWLQVLFLLLLLNPLSHLDGS